MQSRKTHLAEIRSQEKLQEMKNSHLSDSGKDEFEHFYYDDEHSNYEEYLRQQEENRRYEKFEKSLPADSFDEDYFGDD